MLLTGLNTAPKITLPPSLIGTQERPDWLTVTEEHIERSKFLVSPDILNSENPLCDSRYLSLEFPARVGRVADIVTLFDAGVFKKPIGNKDFWYISGEELPSGLEFLYNICEQFNSLDYLIHNHPRTLWHFDVDIKQISRGNIHRKFFPDQDENYHVDGGVNNLRSMHELLSDVREGRQIFSTNESKVIAKSIPRMYLTAASVPELDGCFTEFRNAAKKFVDWDIVQFFGEEHRSPEVPNTCVRFFLRGIARSI